ncbi:hypothetical protein [Alicyclobacillus ferrooxydans]|uniref:Uncharacterized protein n=1 Tax=Alicyclobacillus ferrooxydans TaxID=471514 RepID=A0A0P9GIR0_9BACL|nr:hypothetical protein [Alicyclobacillus ferrooxydans]KPV39912.1 hypothetical protein AN477_21995 [Alicyclobacillus ferrooxydans]
MRRKLRHVPHARNRAVVYTCAVVSMVAYAIPRIPKLEHGVAGTFSMVWILFAVLALAANIYFLVGADKERSRMLESRGMRMAARESTGAPAVRQRSVR